MSVGDAVVHRPRPAAVDTAADGGADVAEGSVRVTVVLRLPVDNAAAAVHLRFRAAVVHAVLSCIRRQMTDRPPDSRQTT